MPWEAHRPHSSARVTYMVLNWRRTKKPSERLMWEIGPLLSAESPDFSKQHWEERAQPILQGCHLRVFSTSETRPHLFSTHCYTAVGLCGQWEKRFVLIPLFPFLGQCNTTVIYAFPACDNEHASTNASPKSLPRASCNQHELIGVEEMLNIRRASRLTAHEQSKKKHEKLKKRDSLPSVEHYSVVSYVLLNFFCSLAKTQRGKIRTDTWKEE